MLSEPKLLIFFGNSLKINAVLSSNLFSSINFVSLSYNKRDSINKLKTLVFK